MASTQDTSRQRGELNARELLRWTWRQLTSMRTALVLLLLLALASIPGSLIPQEDVDALAVSRWREAHPKLTPIYERLDLFSVYDSPWFSAIYLLLMISLVGCILPRTVVYARALRARPPAAPRNLTRLPESATYVSSDDVATVLERAQELLKRRRYRVEASQDSGGQDSGGQDSGGQDSGGQDWVAAEKGYLREAGNLLFHLAVLIVLVGFAIGGLFGYKGGVIVVVGNSWSNSLTQYDDFVPGSLFQPDNMEDFTFRVKKFDIDWLTSGPRAGMARQFVADLDYTESVGATPKSYDLRVNHPLAIGNTEVFLIGHGYAPVITVRDGNGDIALSGPTIFLPTDGTFQSFGVVKAADAQPDQIGLEGTFYPTFAMDKDANGNLSMPRSAFGDALDPLVSMLVYTGDLGMDDGQRSGVYTLNKAKAELVKHADGRPFRVDMRPGDEVKLPHGMGTVSFDGLERWNKIQISQTPGKWVALLGVVAALIGLLGSLYIRPRRIWVRARRENGRTTVELGALDRSSGGDPERGRAELAEIVELLSQESAQKENA